MVDYYSPLILSINATNSTDQYYIPANTGISGSSIESQRQSKLYSSYDAEGIFINVSANGDTTNRPFVLRINGSNTALSATMTASTTGLFQDNTNSVSISSGDLLSMLLDRSNANSVTIRSMGLFLKSPQPVNKLSCPPFSFNTASVTRYVQVPGDGGTPGATETSSYRIVLPVDCVISNFYSYVVSNARTTSTTLTLRKNAADQTPVLTIPASTTGFIEDTSNTVAYASGDDYSVKLVTGSGSGTIAFGQIGFDIINDDTGSFTQISAGVAVFASNSTVHRGQALGGRITAATGVAIANMQIPMRGNSTLRDFRFYCSANTSTISTALDFEVNGALAGISISIPPTTTGTYSDLSTEISITDGDLINLYGLSSAGTGSKLISWMTYEIDQFVTPPAGAGGVQSLMFWY